MSPEWVHIALGVVGVILTLATTALTSARLVANQFNQRLDEQFKALKEKIANLEQSNQREVDQWRKVDRDLLTLKADLPLNYVRREDYIRNQSVIELKIDSLAMRIESLKPQLTNVRHDS